MFNFHANMYAVCGSRQSNGNLRKGGMLKCMVLILNKQLPFICLLSFTVAYLLRYDSRYVVPMCGLMLPLWVPLAIAK